jgi:hypothetical protein
VRKRPLNSLADLALVQFRAFSDLSESSGIPNPVWM